MGPGRKPRRPVLSERGSNRSDLSNASFIRSAVMQYTTIFHCCKNFNFQMMILFLIFALIIDLGYTFRAGPRVGVAGGALEAEVLNRAAKAARGKGESMKGGLNPPLIWGKFCKLYVSEKAFQAILKPIFPYSITSILSKVRHSNT